MSGIRVDIVVTSIGDGSILRRLAEDLHSVHYGEYDLSVIAIPDRKTPRPFYAAAADLRATGVRVSCPTVEAQNEWLDVLGVRDLTVEGSDHRRNVGFLEAMSRGTEAVISLDDDNFPCETGFVEAHSLALSEPVTSTVASSDGWYDPMLLLGPEPMTASSRGFPYFARKRPRTLVDEAGTDLTTVANIGLWNISPDVDAIARLGPDPRSEWKGQSAVLAPGTFAPMSCQNTSVRGDSLVAYYYPRCGASMGSGTIERFGDILSGMFLQVCARPAGDVVRIGGPACDHIRNTHDLWTDLAGELPGILFTEELFPAVANMHPQASSYDERYLELSHLLDDLAPSLRRSRVGVDGEVFLHWTAFQMRRWLLAAERATDTPPPWMSTGST